VREHARRDARLRRPQVLGVRTRSPPTWRMATSAAWRSPRPGQRADPAPLDEPTAGMNPNESARLTEFHGQDSRRAGHLDPADRHDMKSSWVSSRSRCRPRQKIAEGKPQEIRENERVVGPTSARPGVISVADARAQRHPHPSTGTSSAQGHLDSRSTRRIVTLIGSNGAGKSTTLRSILGPHAPPRGLHQVRGQRDRRYGPQEIVASGSPVARGAGAFSVCRYERTRAGRVPAPGLEGGGRPATRSISSAARSRSQKAGTMSGGEQQMLAIGRALMASPSSSSSTSPRWHRAHPRRAYLRDDRRDQRAGHDDPARSSRTRTSLSR